MWLPTSLLFVCLLQSVSAPNSAEVSDTRSKTHQDLSFYTTDEGIRQRIRSEADWQHRRRQIVSGLEKAMGPFPQPDVRLPLKTQVVEETEVNGLIRRKLAYHTDQPNRTVSAWLLMPSDVSRPAPAMLCLHQTTPNGKNSPVGLTDRASMHYALELARRGYVTLSPDYPSLGEYDYDFDSDAYASGSMKAIYDNVRAIDVLQSLPEVDARRIGCIGHSLGGHNALFTAVFDERLQAVVTSCGFTSFHKYKGGNLHGWSGPRYMPRIATEFDRSPDKMPFDFHEVLGAIAPRAVFIVAPLRDDNFDVIGVKDVVRAAEPIYRLFGAGDRLCVVYPDAGHDFPSEQREAAYAFLDSVFKTKTP